jgi:hypothetical protein
MLNAAQLARLDAKIEALSVAINTDSRTHILCSLHGPREGGRDAREGNTVPALATC